MRRINLVFVADMAWLWQVGKGQPFAAALGFLIGAWLALLFGTIGAVSDARPRTNRWYHLPLYLVVVIAALGAWAIRLMLGHSGLFEESFFLVLCLNYCLAYTFKREELRNA